MTALVVSKGRPFAAMLEARAAWDEVHVSYTANRKYIEESYPDKHCMTMVCLHWAMVACIFFSLRGTHRMFGWAMHVVASATKEFRSLVVAIKAPLRVIGPFD